MALMTLCAGALAASDRLSVAIDLTGRHVEDRTLSSQAFGLKLVATHERLWAKPVRSNLRLRTDIETGTTTTQFSDPYGARQRFQLEEAALTLVPHEVFQLQVGALAHPRLGNPLLVDGKAFLGVREILEVPVSAFLIELSAEQTLVPGTGSGILPPSQSAPPLFLMERIRVGYASKAGIQSSAHLSHFKFSNLPSNLAYESRFLGNSVAGLGKDNNRFVYGFEGLEAGIKIGYLTDRKFSLSLALVGLANLAAAEPQANGVATTLGSQIPLSDTFLLSPEVSVFRLESDASPSSFSKSAWGHSNRQGFSIGLAGEFPLEKMHVLLQYTSASAIRPTPYQSDFQFIGAQFGVEYGIL